MVKKIVLAAVLVVSAAVVGSVVTAKSAPIKVTPQSPKGWCLPPGGHC